jgi:hypothetical protein
MPTDIERLIDKSVALGEIRDVPPINEAFIGDSIAPMMAVESDDVVFTIVNDTKATGMAPARAEDAEAEMYQSDVYTGGRGEASLIDWALKNRYAASDVTRYRDDLIIAGAVGQLNLQTNLVAGFQTSSQKFQAMLARDTIERKSRLEHRLEWMQVTPLVNNRLTYNDGHIKFDVVYGRPSNQTDQAPASGLWDFTSNADFDVIGDLLAVKETFFDLYGLELEQGILSKKVINQWYRSTKFRQLGLFGAGLQNPAATDVDPNYIGAQVSPTQAIAYVEAQTGITFRTYDASIRTRDFGTQNPVQMRFMPTNRVILLPNLAAIQAIDDSGIGFGKTLSSPHPEGNWESGFYEWEQETVDPWQHVRGTGIKAFPVFPYMKWSYTMKVQADA